MASAKVVGAVIMVVGLCAPGVALRDCDLMTAGVAIFFRSNLGVGTPSAASDATQLVDSDTSLSSDQLLSLESSLSMDANSASVFCSLLETR